MKLKSIKRKSISLLLSVMIHLFILIFSLIINYLTIKDDYSSKEFLTFNLENDFNTEFDEKYSFLPEEKKEENNIDQSVSDNVNSVKSIFLSDSLIQIADTTILDSIYKDDSRGISIKFPFGWTFIDQKINSKFDGVTFWPSEINDNIPYIHLEVVDKDLFNKNRYEFNSRISDYIWYFNNPETINEFVNFEIYIRTQEDVDYKIKLIVKGLKNFERFYPKFLAMLRSLKIKKGYFDVF